MAVKEKTPEAIHSEIESMKQALDALRYEMIERLDAVFVGVEVVTAPKGKLNLAAGRTVTINGQVYDSPGSYDFDVNISDGKACIILKNGANPEQHCCVDSDNLLWLTVIAPANSTKVQVNAVYKGGPWRAMGINTTCVDCGDTRVCGVNPSCGM